MVSFMVSFKVTFMVRIIFWLGEGLVFVDKIPSCQLQRRELVLTHPRETRGQR